MEIKPTHIEGLVEIQPLVHGDQRGYFVETFNDRAYFDLGVRYNFVQDNCSYSKYGTLRGLHFQMGDAAQAKLVTCLQGKVLDVAVDLRPDSPTFKQHCKVILDGEKKNQFMVPRGFAHGFVVLSETALFAYKCDNYYNPKKESGIIYNDPYLDIDWMVPEEDLILSKKDANLPALDQIT